MKTYNLFYACMALLVLMGCSKNDSDALGESEEKNNLHANYTLIVNNQGSLSGTLFNVEDEAFTIKPEESKFAA
ncbi:hypothetical protein, partial [Zobellia laminariae]